MHIGREEGDSHFQLSPVVVVRVIYRGSSFNFFFAVASKNHSLVCVMMTPFPQ